MIVNNDIGFIQDNNVFGGRLGNQLFQYASLFGISKHKNVSYGISNKYKTNLKWNELTDEDNYKNQNKMVLNLCFDLNYIDSQNLNFPLYTENPPFDLNIFDNSIDNVDIRGIFQNEMYFSKYRTDLLSALSFKSELLVLSASYIYNLKRKFKTNIVSVHFRRTDYLTMEWKYHILDDTYYGKAINEFDSDSVFLYFSDDIQHLHSLNLKNNHIVCDVKNQFLELCIMSMCDHNIISNSTFSWWGAYLNKNGGKVISPKNWYINEKDIGCDNWIKL